MSKQIELDHNEIKRALAYIASFWPNLERFHPQDDTTLVGLPRPYLVPAYEEGNAFSFNEMYYWDSYFMIQGMLDDEHKVLVTGILDNLLSLLKRFGVVPNASRLYHTSRSQPPFLTSIILDVYKLLQHDPHWLAGRDYDGGKRRVSPCLDEPGTPALAPGL